MSTWIKRKCRVDAESISFSAEDSSSTQPTVKLRAEKLDDDALKEDGRLKIRLDKQKLHCADIAKGHARCSLHRWAGFETQKHISYCETCNVNLCQGCFKYFHITCDIPGDKEMLKKKFKKEHDAIVAQRKGFQEKKGIERRLNK